LHALLLPLGNLLGRRLGRLLLGLFLLGLGQAVLLVGESAFFDVELLALVAEDLLANLGVLEERLGVEVPATSRALLGVHGLLGEGQGLLLRLLGVEPVLGVLHRVARARVRRGH